MCRSWRFCCSPAFSEEAQVLEGCVVKGFARLHSAVQVAAARVSFHTPCLYSRGERRIKELPATPQKRKSGRSARRASLATFQLLHTCLNLHLAIFKHAQASLGK